MAIGWMNSHNKPSSSWRTTSVPKHWVVSPAPWGHLLKWSLVSFVGLCFVPSIKKGGKGECGFLPFLQHMSWTIYHLVFKNEFILYLPFFSIFFTFSSQECFLFNRKTFNLYRSWAYLSISPCLPKSCCHFCLPSPLLLALPAAC